MIGIAQAGEFISLTLPLISSMYNETRFVTRDALFDNGWTLIAFFFTFFFAEELPPAFGYLKYGSLAFLLIGGYMLALYWQWFPIPLKIKMNTFPSLVFSWKNFGAFELALLVPIYFSTLPSLYQFLPSSWPILNLGVNLFVGFWLATLVFFIYKNYVRKMVSSA